MLHNIFFIITVTAFLMFLDYYLTIKGARLYKQGFSEHVKIDNYELNPKFQKNIEEFKYSFRHLWSVILVAAMTYFFYYLSKGTIYIGKSFDILLGLLFTLMGYINANHLRNIIIFKAVSKNPDMLKGQVEQTYLFLLKASQAQLFLLFIPLLFILIMTPSYFVYGAMLAVIVLYFTFSKWK